ncbi:UDP-3-O-acyl-N-acetylglucosamine deacetylase [bacterium]|nr:UDP-3-O-acyl-N-acetylglucosamine deacetylase [bacterium]
MTTILNKIELTGKGLMKNRDCEVLIMPSNEGKIRLFIENSLEPVELCADNVVATNHCVVIGEKRKKLMLTEHLTAACAFCGIDSLDIHFSKSEVPILDGSSKEWVRLFKEAGIEKRKRKFYTVSEPVYYLNGKTHLVILPDKELSISYGVNYDHPDLTKRWVSFDRKNVDEIIEARTFGFLKDLKKFQLFGFAKGVTYENTVGLDGDGYTTELRSEFEPAKHKMLDLIGDLYLTGYNPLDFKAQIIVKEAGHAVHVIVAKMLKDKIIEA